jgi:hypothetical protein
MAAAEPPRIRVAVLRSVEGYGHIRAEVEAYKGPDSLPAALTIGYEVLSAWLDLAAKAEDVAHRIVDARGSLAYYESEAAGFVAQADIDGAVARVREAEAKLAALVAARNELLGKMAELPPISRGTG